MLSIVGISIGHIFDWSQGAIYLGNRVSVSGNLSEEVRRHCIRTYNIGGRFKVYKYNNLINVAIFLFTSCCPFFG